jgi:hypothetical protein
MPLLYQEKGRTRTALMPVLKKFFLPFITNIPGGVSLNVKRGKQGLEERYK